MKKDDKGPFILGITGSIGSGKSAVGKYLSNLGITVIDTDKLVHQLLADDQPTIEAIVEQFGAEVLADNSTTIDRKKLGRIVFGSADARHILESIVHPNTILALRKEVESLGDVPLVAVQVPLLFESNLQSEYDQIWTVFTDETTMRERLKKRDGLDDAEIDKRLSAQLPQKNKIERADQVIDNSFSEAETERQVKLLVEKILPNQAP